MLIVLLPESSSAEQLASLPLYWWRSDAASVLAESGQDSLARLRVRFPAERLRVLAPATVVNLHRVAIPVRSTAAARAALPFALEDQLGQELEDLHLVVGPRRAEGRYSAAVVARQQMTTWLEACNAAGWPLDALLPQAALHADLAPKQGLCVQPSPWPMPGQALVTSADAEPALIDTSMLGFWLHQRLAQLDDEQQRIALHGYSAAELGLSEAIIDEPEQGMLAGLEAALQQAQQQRPLNLLTGAYAKGMATPPWRKLRPLIIAAGILLTTWVGLQVVETLALNSERQRVLAAIDQLFADTLPGSRQVEAVTQFRQVLTGNNGAGAQSGTGGLLYEVLTIVRETGSSEIRQLRATPEEVELELQLPSFAKLESIRGKLSASPSLSETLQGADSASSGVVARLKVQRGDL